MRGGDAADVSLAPPPSASGASASDPRADRPKRKRDLTFIGVAPPAAGAQQPPAPTSSAPAADASRAEAAAPPPPDPAPPLAASATSVEVARTPVSPEPAVALPTLIGGSPAISLDPQISSKEPTKPEGTTPAPLAPRSAGVSAPPKTPSTQPEAPAAAPLPLADDGPNVANKTSAPPSPTAATKAQPELPEFTVPARAEAEAAPPSPLVPLMPVIPPAAPTSPSLAALADHPLAATTKSLGVAPPPPPSEIVAGRTSPRPATTDHPLAATRKSPAAMATLAGGTSPLVDLPKDRKPSSAPPGPLGGASGTLVGGVAAIAVGNGPPRKMTPLSGTPAPRIVPAAGTPPPPIVLQKTEPPQAPIIRIPQGGLLGGSGSKLHERAGTLICEILVKNGAVKQAAVDKALLLQEERGGQIGRILVSMGACTEEAIARALVEQLRVRKDNVDIDVSAAARENKDVAGLRVLTQPGRTIAVIVATDLFAFLLAALLATGLHWMRTYSELGEIDWTSWLVVGPSIALCMLTFLGLELYSPMAKSTPDEIRDIVFASSLVHFGASMLSTLGDLPIVKWGIAVRGTWWLATLFLVPVLRSLVRNQLSVLPWWGIPVCVLGASKTGRLIVRTLKAQPRSGLKPVMLLDDDPLKHGTLRASFTNEVMDVYSINVSAATFMSEAQRKALADDLFGASSSSAPPPGDEDVISSTPISSDHIPTASSHPPPASSALRDEFFAPESAKPRSERVASDATLFPRGKFAEVEGVPVVGDLSLAPILAQRLKIPHAVVAMPGVDSHKLVQIVERIGGKFSHLLIIPDLFGFATLGVPAKNVGGILGVEVRQQLLLPGPRLAKRIMDVALTCFGSMFVAPFLVVIALLIKLDSKGPIFYTQKRLGKDGGYFDAYKFRTMHGDGEARLKAILDADPQLRAEYEIYHKLKKDPRVTRIGRVLRKFSLDEFPQLLNVIKGDMSLVGPRPYIERELTEMSGQEKIILRAPPGMTGMWQVSDRNATSFAQRVQIDVYYVRNWSPWLDIHILAKTFGVVVKGSGH